VTPPSAPSTTRVIKDTTITLDQVWPSLPMTNRGASRWTSCTTSRPASRAGNSRKTMMSSKPVAIMSQAAI